MTDQWRSRRDILKQAGIVGVLGISGCLGDGEDSPPSGRQVTDLTVTGADSAPVSITATATHAQITSEQTAQFELTVTGQRDDPVSLTFGNSIPFSYPQRSTPSGLVLMPGDYMEDKSQQTWLAPTEIPRPLPLLGVNDLTAGDSITREWNVLGDPDHVSYIEPGTYNFTTALTGKSLDDPIEWTLSVTIATGSTEE